MSYMRSELQILAESRESLTGELVIDFHSHIGGKSKWYHLPDSGTEDMVREMDRIGVDKAVTFSFAGITSDYVWGNTKTATEIAKFPDRFIGLAIVNPHYHVEMRDELDRCMGMGMRGIKLIPHYQRYPVDGPNLFPAFEYAHEHSLIMLHHEWGTPQYLDQLATTFSNACFVIGHYFYNPIYSDVINKHDNIFQCTCAALQFGDIENMADAISTEKIVYGSDFTDLPTMFSMAPILYARIPDDDKRKILGLNAQSILERWPGKT